MTIVRPIVRLALALYLSGYLVAAAQPPGPREAPGPSAAEATGDRPTGQGQASPTTDVQPAAARTVARDAQGQIVEVAAGEVPAGDEPVVPDFSIRELKVSGEPQDGKAVLRVLAEITVYRKGWVKVPLGLAGAVLDGKPQFAEGQDTSFVRRDGREGYVWWIENSEPHSIHRIELDAFAPIIRSAGQWRLGLALPAVADWDLNWKVSMPAEARLEDEDGFPLSHLKQQARRQGDSTEFAFENVPGRVQLIWNKLDQTGETTGRAQQVVAVQSIDVRPAAGEGQVEVTWKAELTFDPPLPGDRAIRIRIPAGSRPTQFYERQWHEVDAGQGIWQRDPTGESSQAQCQLQTSGVARLDKALDLAGFAVEGAIRQSGLVALTIDQNWQAQFPELQDVDQVDLGRLPLELRQEGTLAFRYSSGSYRLKALIRKRMRFVRATPSYTYRVKPDGVRLSEAVVDFSIEGPSLRELRIDFPGGWQPETDTIEVLTQGDAPQRRDPSRKDQDESGVTLVWDNGISGTFRVKFSAYLAAFTDGGPLEWSLPHLMGVSVLEPPTVLIESDPDVVLRPLEEQIRGLQPESSGSPTLKYRAVVSDGVSSNARFAATYSVHQREVKTRVFTQVSLYDGKVQQRITYDINYKPLRLVRIELPRSLAQRADVAWTVDNIPVTLSSEEDDEGDLVIRQVPISGGADSNIGVSRGLGTKVLRCEYELSKDQIAEGSDVSLNIPLAMPEDSPPESNDLWITLGADQELIDVASPWLVSEPSGPNSSGRRRELSSNVPENYARLQVRRQARSVLAETVVQRAWIQSLLTPNKRRDRVVYRLTTSTGKLVLRMPEGADLNDIRGSVGRIREDRTDTLGGVQSSVDAQGRLELDFSGAPTSQPSQYVVDILYSFTNRGPENPDGPGRLLLVAPQLPGDVPVEQTYWQVVVPDNEHLVYPPEELASEHSWSWQWLWWTRRPALKQDDLEELTGAQHLEPLPQRVNQYVFSGGSEVHAVSLQTASRSMLVLLGSGLALVAGLLVLHVRAVRRPTAFVLAAVVLLAGTLWAPALALLAMQAAVLGVTLGVISLLIARRAARRRTWDTSESRGGSSLFDLRSTELQPVAAAPSVASGSGSQRREPISTATTLAAQFPSDSES